MRKKQYKTHHKSGNGMGGASKAMIVDRDLNCESYISLLRSNHCLLGRVIFFLT